MADPWPADPMQPYRVIVIDGAIGAGKSTLLRLLAEYLTARGLRVVTAPEPVQVWRDVGALQLFYDNPERNGTEFQTFVYVTRIQSILAALRDGPANPDVVLLERSVLTDRGVFYTLHRRMSADPKIDIRNSMYNTWCDTWNLLLPFDLTEACFVYLRPSLTACMERVNARHRPEEARGDSGGVTTSYQSALIETYDEFIADLDAQGRRVVTIQEELADADYREDPHCTTFCAQLCEQIGI